MQNDSRFEDEILKSLGLHIQSIKPHMVIKEINGLKHGKNRISIPVPTDVWIKKLLRKEKNMMETLVTKKVSIVLPLNFNL